VSSDNYLRIKKATPYYNAIRRVAFPSTSWILVSLFVLDLLGTALAFSVSDPTLSGLLRGFSTEIGRAHV